MLSLQDISDQLEIQQLMIRYASAIDRKDFAALDELFTPDAWIDYRAMGGIAGHYPEIKTWLPEALAGFPHHQHLLANFDVKLAGDRASCRAICFNPMASSSAPGGALMFYGFWYLDEFIRTPAGWRICRLEEERCYDGKLA